MLLVTTLVAVLALGHCEKSSRQNLVWAEEFDEFNLALWKHELTFGSSSGNWEFQRYGNNRTNSYVKDGVLYIKPTLTIDQFTEPGFLESARWDLWGGSPEGTCTGNFQWGCEQWGNPVNILPPIQSARIRSGNRFMFKYGRIEVRAQMPRGDWLWPAIWMMPAYEEYGGWPTSGEIDIVEARGNLDLADVNGNRLGNDHAASTLHWGPFFEGNRWWLTSGGREDDFGHSFHIYEMDWTEFGLVASIDGIPVMQALPGPGGFWELGGYDQDYPGISNPWRFGDFAAPFDKEFYFVMNVAVGGTNGYFGDDLINGNGPKPWHNLSPQAMLDFWNGRDDWLPTWNLDENDGEDAAMKVDYIRIYN